MNFENYIDWLICWLVKNWSVVYIKKNILYWENFYHWSKDLETVKEIFDFMVLEFWEAKRVTETKCYFWETKNHMDFWDGVLSFWSTYKAYNNINILKNDLL